MALSRAWRRRLKLALLVIVSVALAILAMPREDIVLKHLGISTQLKIRRGLDLQGGVYLVYQAEVSQLPKDSSQSTQQVVNNAAAVITRRVNPGGAGEAIVQTAANNRIIVQIPGISDPKSAIATIGRTAQLQFVEVDRVNGKQQAVPTDVSGQDVSRATVDFIPQTGKPVVSLELKGGNSTQKFAALTEKLAASGNLLVALLDQQVVFGPATVQNPITDGRAQLSGNFTVAQAKDVATLLNAGALPVPVQLVAEHPVGPPLGELSIKQSLVAAVVGLLSVSLFLLIYYRWAGLMAVCAITFYTMALTAIIKLSVFTPYVIVLTLAGIAGFIMSIAVAVDANILIAERIKEEIVKGSSAPKATIDGFNHAWTSIRDANATTIISATILYIFGAPLIRGFALTLGIGVAISLTTAFTVSRFLLNTMSRSRLATKRSWIGLKVGGGK